MIHARMKGTCGCKFVSTAPSEIRKHVESTGHEVRVEGTVVPVYRAKVRA